MMFIKALYTRYPIWKDVSLPSVYKEVWLYAQKTWTLCPPPPLPNELELLGKAGAVVFCITDVWLSAVYTCTKGVPDTSSIPNGRHYSKVDTYVTHEKT